MPICSSCVPLPPRRLSSYPNPRPLSMFRSEEIAELVARLACLRLEKDLASMEEEEKQANSAGSKSKPLLERLKKGMNELNDFVNVAYADTRVKGLAESHASGIIDACMQGKVNDGLKARAAAQGEGEGEAKGDAHINEDPVGDASAEAIASVLLDILKIKPLKGEPHTHQAQGNDLALAAEGSGGNSGMRTSVSRAETLNRLRKSSEHDRPTFLLGAPPEAVKAVRYLREGVTVTKSKYYTTYKYTLTLSADYSTLEWTRSKGTHKDRSLLLDEHTTVGHPKDGPVHVTITTGAQAAAAAAADGDDSLHEFKFKFQTNLNALRFKESMELLLQYKTGTTQKDFV